MKSPIRRSDVSLFTAIVVPVSQKVPAHLVTADETYLGLVNRVPGWFFWLSVGFGAAVLIFESAKEGSRVRQFWAWLTKKFDVEDLFVGNWSDENGPMPQSDTGVRIHLRFRKTMRPARLRMHVLMCSDTGRKPASRMFDFTLDEVVKGQIVPFPIVTAGMAQPGWDHQRQRGWGRKLEDDLIGGSGNIVTIECEGLWTTQRHKIFVKCVSNDKRPSIFAISEDQANLFNCAFLEK